MSLTRFAIQKEAFTQFVVVLLVIGGLFSYLTLGRLEDPDFTVKTGIIITAYPGAGPEEVKYITPANNPLRVTSIKNSIS